MEILRLFALASILAWTASAQVFPSAVASDPNLLVGRNRGQSTLSSDITDSATSFSVAGASSFANNIVLVVDNEQIYCAVFSGTTFSSCQRGFDGTTAASHSSGAAVRAGIVAAHHNRLANEIKAIEAALGANLQNVVKTSSGAVQAGGLLYASAAGTAATDTGLQWDAAANSLRIGTTSLIDPNTQLQIESSSVYSQLWIQGTRAGDANSSAGIILSGGGGGGVGDYAALGFSNNGLQNWTVTGYWPTKNGDDFDIFESQTGTSRFRIDKTLGQVIIPTSDDKAPWFHNSDGSLNEDLWLGRATDSASPMVKFITSDSDLLKILIGRDTGDFQFARTDASDPNFTFFRVRNINTGDAFAELIGDTGRGAYYQAYRDRQSGNFWSWGVDQYNGWHLTNGQFNPDDPTESGGGGRSIININNETSYFGIGPWNINPSATLHVMDNTASTGSTTFTLQQGAGQSLTEPFLMKDYGGASLASISADGQYSQIRTDNGGGTYGSFGHFTHLSQDSQIVWAGNYNSSESDDWDLALARHGAGILKLTDADTTDYFLFDGPNLRMQFGGTGSSFPSLVKYSGNPWLAAAVADGSNYTKFIASSLDLDNYSASQQTSIIFYEVGTAKWQIGKQTDSTFFLFDAANSVDRFTISTGGFVKFQPTSGNIDLVANSGGTATATGIVNFDSSASTQPNKTGTSLPATCGVGQTYFKSDADPGSNLYLCTSADTWTQVTGSGGSAGGVYAAAFTSQDPLSIAAGTHNLGNCPASLSIFTDDGTNYVFSESWDTWYCNKTTYAITVDFPASTTGYVIASRGGAGAFNTAADYTPTGRWDFATGKFMLPGSTTLPATCSIREMYFDTDATAGVNVYGCTASNTWTLMGDGGGGGGSVLSVFGRTGGVVAASGDYTAAQVTNAASTASTNTFSALQTLSVGAAFTCASLPGSPAAGRLVCDSGDSNKPKWYNGGSWVDLTGGGGSGTPGGSNGQLQFNSSGSFAGFTGASVASTTMTFTGLLDMGGGSFIDAKGTTLPATCTVGQKFFDTDATAGQNSYGCTATNTWTLQGDGGGAGSGAPTGAEYLVGALNGTLSAELLATAGDGMLLTKTSGAMTFAIDNTYVATLGGTNTFSGDNYLSLGQGYGAIEYSNASSTGTVTYSLAKLDSSAEAVRAATSDTAGLVGICVSGCGTSGTSIIVFAGRVDCNYDNAPAVLGGWVTMAIGTAGYCHYAGTSRPGSGIVVGRVMETGGAPGTYEILAGGDLLR